MARRGTPKMPAPAPEPRRQVAFRLGLSAETRAAAFLLAKGFRIAARRWRSPAGEIDLVARRGTLLIFAEVKARATRDGAAYAVTERQKRRIAAAAAAWLAEHPDDGACDIRFDAILIVPRRWPLHIEAAFDSEALF